MKYIYSIVIFLIAMPVYAQTVGSREFNFGFAGFSEILYPSYMNNYSELREIHRVMSYEKENILAGVSHIALVSNIRTGDKNNAAGINRASAIGSVVRAFLKTRYGLSDRHFTFCFDDSSNTEHNVRVAILNRAISAGENRNIYYTKSSSRYDYIMMQYGSIPMSKADVAVQRYAVAEPVKETPVVTANNPSTTVGTGEVRTMFLTELPADKKAEDIKTEEVKAEENKVVYIQISDYVGRKQNKDKVVKTRDGYYPRFAVKTNGLSWAGYTTFSYADFFNQEPFPTEFGNVLPNIEVEYYFNGRFSIAGEAEYNSKNYSDNYWWKIASYSLEPRFWLGKRDLFRGAYLGLFGMAGDYDIKEESDVNKYGYTGMHYGGGLSLGYLQPIYKGLAIEIGIRGGYQYIDRDTYIFNNGLYDRQGSDVIDGFRVLGIKASLMYRFKRR